MLLFWYLLTSLFAHLKSVSLSEPAKVRTSGVVFFPFLFPAFHIWISLSSDRGDSGPILAGK